MTTPYPKWARWIAQDEDGEIYVFDEPPRKSVLGHWVPYYGTLSEYICQGTPNPHWRHSLDCLGDDDETI